MEKEELDQLCYVLKFALQVIEDNDLQQTKNKDNWRIGQSLENQIEVVSISIGDIKILGLWNGRTSMIYRNPYTGQ